MKHLTFLAVALILAFAFQNCSKVDPSVMGDGPLSVGKNNCVGDACLNGSDGSADGSADGTADGSADGSADGTADGSADGSADGNADGSSDGGTEGGAPLNASYCEEQRERSVLMIHPNKIENLDADFAAVVSDVESVRQVRSNPLVLIGENENAHIGLIQGFRGKLILCGVSVDRIVDTRGKLVIINTNVGSLENKRGSVHSINSNLEYVVDMKGNLLQK